MTSVTITDGDGNEHRLPGYWEICSSCQGEGKTSRHVERDGGGFTSSEWAEEDEDFKIDYLAGRYDRPCEACNGTGKVVQVDEEAIKGNAKLLKVWESHMEGVRRVEEMEMERAAERRMGC